MCNLCSINHHIDDEDDDAAEPSLCVHQANHLASVGSVQDAKAQTFEAVQQPTRPMLSGSSF